jgi:hypothetical protein
VGCDLTGHATWLPLPWLRSHWIFEKIVHVITAEPIVFHLLLHLLLSLGHVHLAALSRAKRCSFIWNARIVTRRILALDWNFEAALASPAAHDFESTLGTLAGQDLELDITNFLVVDEEYFDLLEQKGIEFGKLLQSAI